jgi:hypothetical protein
LQAICVQDQEIKVLKEKHEEDKEPINIAGDGKYDSPGEWKVDLTMHSNDPHQQKHKFKLQSLMS